MGQIAVQDQVSGPGFCQVAASAQEGMRAQGDVLSCAALQSGISTDREIHAPAGGGIGARDGEVGSRNIPQCCAGDVEGA